MKNSDPVINGYSRSVIQNLIKMLDSEADRHHQKALKLPAGEDHDEVVAMRNLVKMHKHLIMMLMRWSICKDSFSIITRHVVAFKDFLAGASALLAMLAPKE